MTEGGLDVYSRFVLRSDAREVRALIGLAGGIAGKIVRELAAATVAVARARASKVWTELRENAERGARGWR